MLEHFLHEQLEIAFNYGVPKPEMPSFANIHSQLNASDSSEFSLDKFWNIWNYNTVFL